MDLRLPSPCVVVLIGPTRTGKTTWAHNHFASNEIVSSDQLRAAVGIDEGDQVASGKAFELLHSIAEERMRRGLTTVIDTTGLDKGERLRWIEGARRAEIPIHAILFAGDQSTIEGLNSLRDHPIPKSVLKKQITAFGRAVVEVEDEGFDGVHRERPVRVVTMALSAPSTDSPPEAGHTFGLLLSRFNWSNGHLGENVRRIAWRAEDVGFTDIWVMDHFRQIHQVGRQWEDIPEAYTALAHLAGATTGIRFGALVTGVTHRNPVVLGKMLATLDVLSGGRAICGLGAGWDAEEHAAYGIQFPPLRERYEILEDTLRMLPLLWGKGTPRFEGKTFSADELICYPRPIQDPIPILVGGSGEKKTLRLVAQYADACNLFGEPEKIRAKVDVLERHCGDLDRDPGEIVVTHLVNTMVASDRSELRGRIDKVRDRNQTVEDFSRRNRAGVVEDVVAMFSAYAEAGAGHSIVALPDVALEGSIEAFGEVIRAFE